jgi:putative membrane protein
MAVRETWAASVAVVVMLLVNPAPARGAAPSELDMAFLVAAHQSYLAEVAAGDEARVRASTQRVKDLGARTAEGYRRLDDVVQQVARAATVSLPAALNDEQRAMADRLTASSVQDYEALWLSTRMDAHMQAMANARQESDRGSDPAVRRAAQDAVPIIASHQQEIESAARDLGVLDAADPADAETTAIEDSSDRTTVLFVAGLAAFLLLCGGAAALSATRR